MDNQEFLKKGKEKELELINLLKLNQFNESYECATKDQDIYEHWDFKIVNETKIDVKSLRKISRTDSKVNENYSWIEILNVHGNKGSLYGDADVIVFETIDYWIFVKRKKLQEFIEDKCKDKIRTTQSTDALYKLYSRTDRKDVITQIKTLDLCFISYKIIKK
jgi:hypothetical protein